MNTILVKRIATETERQLPVFDVEILGVSSQWIESFATEREVIVFLKGIRVAYAMDPEHPTLVPPFEFHTDSCIQEWP